MTAVYLYFISRILSYKLYVLLIDLDLIIDLLNSEPV